MSRILLRRPRRILLGVLVSLVLCVLVLERWPVPTLDGSGASLQDLEASSGPWADDTVGDALLDFLPMAERSNYTVRVPIPLVSRTILERLHSSDPEGSISTEEADDDRDGILDQADARYASGKHHAGRWPPIVTTLPEARSSSSRPQVLVHTPAASTEGAIDEQFCARVPCRLLVLLAITEREPRMQEQLLQVLALAKALGRTVVLPNVGKGRIGTCQRWDFDTYFDVASAVRAGGGRVMLMDNFRTWVDARPRSPTMHSVVIDESPIPEARKALESSSGLQEKARKNTRCFASRFRSLDLDYVEATTIHLLPLVGQEQHLDEAAILVNGLAGNISDSLNPQEAVEEGPPPRQKNNELTETDGALGARRPSSSTAEILFLHWDVHRELGPTSPDTSIDYSPRLWTLADKVTQEIQPYLAVHWHVDKVSATVLPACADALVDILDVLLHDHSVAEDIRTVYFSSDYPLLELDTKASPMTDKRMSYLHRQAGAILRAAFEAGGELEHWRLKAKEELLAPWRRGSNNSVEEDELPLDDVGVQEMLAKAISMKAALFVSNTKGCGRMSMTAKQVADFRASARGREARNVVSLFG